MSGPLDPLPQRARDMLATLSAWEQDDSAVVAIMRAAADELDAVTGVAEAVRDGAWPHRATDAYGILGIHEAMLGLPVNPQGVALADRQASVQARIQGRKSGSTENWIARMNVVMRGQGWNYTANAPGPGQITIRIPYQQGTYSSKQAEALARRFTPAHIEIVMAYSQGFIVGVSRVGRDAI